MKKIITRYLHSSKENSDIEEINQEIIEEHQANGTSIPSGELFSIDAMNKLAYALYEVEFELEADTETGEYIILSVVDGKQKLKHEAEPSILKETVIQVRR